MRLQITLSDDLYDAYVSQAETLSGAGASVTPAEVIEDRLARFHRVAPSDRCIVVDTATRARLEKLLSGGSLLDSQDLLRKVEKLADVSIGEIHLDFTTSEVARIHRWSKNGGRPLSDLLPELVGRIKMGIFDYV